jgi:drug/metabolite transporter (DMT)-like permease
MTPRQLAMLASVSAIWGASYLLIKIALDGFAPSMIVFSRVLLAAVILYLVIHVRGGEDRAALGWLRRHPRRALVQGTLAVGIPFMLITFGETQISSGLTGVLISPGPLFIAALAPLIDPTEKVDRRAGTGVVIGFAGVVLLIGVDTLHSAGEFLGALAMVGAALAYGLGAMYARLKFRGVPPLVVSLAACGVAAVLTMPAALATLGENSPDAGEIAAVVSLGVIGTAAAFWLYFGLIGEAGAGRAALCGYLIPPLALAYGAILLDEEITAAAIGGLVLILAGVALAGGEREVEGTPSELEAAGAAARPQAGAAARRS